MSSRSDSSDNQIRAMDQICGSKFWDLNSIWQTNDPDFTECFKKTILAWLPCGFLWILCPFEILLIWKSLNRSAPRTWLLTSKLVLILLLKMLTIADFGLAIYNNNYEKVYEVEYYTPFVKIITFTLAAMLLIWNRKSGRRNSGPLFMFWFLLAVCGAFQFRSTVTKIGMQDERTYHDTSYALYYSLVCVVCLLNFFAEGKPKSPDKQSPMEMTSPQEYASFPSNMIYVPFDALAWQGFKKPLEQEDLWTMRHEDTARGTVELFQKYWQKALRDSGRQCNKKPSLSKTNGKIIINHDKRKRILSTLPGMWKSFRTMILAGGFLKLLYTFTMLLGPFILRLLIQFVSGDAPLWKGLLYAILLLVSRVIGTLLSARHAEYMQTAGLRMRTTIIGALYRKCLRIANFARKETTIGEVVNLMSVDAQSYLELSLYVHELWCAFVEIFVCVWFLQNILGASIYAGLGLMVLIIPLNCVLFGKISSLRKNRLTMTDSRIKLLNEILNGIKVIKLYAWESSFEKQVSKIRNEEIKLLKVNSYCICGLTFTWLWIPVTVCLASLATYVYVDDSHVLDAEKIFVSLTLFSLVQLPLSLFPEVLVSTIQAMVSLKRIDKFMNAEELDPNNVQHDSPEVDPLIIEDGQFSWDSDKSVEPTLKNINFRVERNQLVAIVGPVGSGKSSVLSALLGEMDRLNGRVITMGSIAYVAQQAWIQNASVRDNILFGSPFDEATYNRIVDACALRPDLEVFPAGDRTEIGENGINLSGGQKQRISLARAVYNGAEIYLLDDPLSAVDAHVGNHIFENVIGPNGLLKSKTRILVTHGITYLPEVDNIFVLKHGEITEHGSYNDLLEKKGAFSEFLQQHLQEFDPDVINEDDKSHDEALKVQLTEAKSPIDDIHGGCEPPRKSTASNNFQTEFLPEFSHRKFSGIRNRSLSVKEIREDKVASGCEDRAKCIEDENVETGTVKRDIYKYYFRAVGWTVLGFTCVSKLFYEMSSIGANSWLGVWADDNATHIDGIVDIAKQNMYIEVYAALVCLQAIFLVGSLFIFVIGCIRSSKMLHENLLFTILRIPSGYFNVIPSARILNRFGKDLNVVDDILPMDLRVWIFTIMSLAGTIVVIIYTTPIFIVVLVPIAIVYYFLQLIYVASSRQLKRLESVSRSPMFSYSSETISGSSTIRAYRAQERFISEAEQKINKNQVCAFCSIMGECWIVTRLDIISTITVFFAALFSVLQRDSISASLVGLSLTYALQTTNWLQWLVRASCALESNIVSVERIKEYDEMPREAAWEVAEHDPDKEWPTEGCIEFRDYKLRYREDLDFALRDLTFTVSGGEKVGIVGRTGAGKSSLTLALFRMIEGSGGQILIDNVDISKIGLHSLRSKLTIIPQDPVLFSGTLRRNLDPFDMHTDDELWLVLEQAYLKEYAQGLKGGLMHEIAEGGSNLSVGQRQLVCLARALLRRTKILILDEATASVDLTTDEFIQTTIRTEFKNCTVLTIAHRLNTILDSDRVIVLDQGRVEEIDSPENLLQDKTSQFYLMARDAGLVA